MRGQIESVRACHQNHLKLEGLFHISRVNRIRIGRPNDLDVANSIFADRHAPDSRSKFAQEASYDMDVAVDIGIFASPWTS